MTGSSKLQEGALGIGVGNHGAGGNFLAIGEDYPGNRAPFYGNLRDFGASADLRARFLRDGSHGLREAAHAAAGMEATPA